MVSVHRVKSNESFTHVLEQLLKNLGLTAALRSRMHMKESRFEAALRLINGISRFPNSLNYLILPRLHQCKKPKTLESVVGELGLSAAEAQSLKELNHPRTIFSSEELIIAPPNVKLELKDQEIIVSYQVKRNCYLWDIAIEELGNPILDKQIAKINNISNWENRISKGATLKLPLPDQYKPEEKDVEHWNEISSKLDSFLSISPELSSIENAKQAYIKILSLDWLEGYRSCMYKDHRQILTIGIGTNIHSFDSFEKKGVRANMYLCDHRRDSGGNCWNNDHTIRPDSTMVRELYNRALSEFPVKCQKIILQYVDAENIAKNHLDKECTPAIKSEFEDYATYPTEALVALYDLMYKLGSKKFTQGFPKCCQVIKDRDWRKAALESHLAEKQPGESQPAGGVRRRNILVYQLFVRGFNKKS